MKRLIFLFLLTAIFGLSISAQKNKSKIPALPAEAAQWVNDDSSAILENSVIQHRLKKLLGEKDYDAFKENWETLNPIVEEGNFLFTSGCIIHGCLHAEAAIAIDLKNNTIHAAIYTEPEKVRYFNERGTKTPKPFAEWANRFDPPKKLPK